MTISISKKSKKIILIGCIILFIIIIGLLISGPIMDTIDKNRFLTLDSQIQKLYDSVKANSSESDAWIYEKSCESEYSGPWPTGSYFCTAKISLTKTVTTAEEVADLQNKYYPIINNSGILKASSELNLQLPNDFGINFVVSSAERRYNEEKSTLGCKYTIDLFQNNNSTTKSYEENVSLGSTINNGLGKVVIALESTNKARSNWYIAN